MFLGATHTETPPPERLLNTVKQLKLLCVNAVV